MTVDFEHLSKLVDIFKDSDDPVKGMLVMMRDLAAKYRKALEHYSDLRIYGKGLGGTGYEDHGHIAREALND